MAAFREKNQDPMLQLAGQYFSTLTCGAFNSLVIDDVATRGPSEACVRRPGSTSILKR